MADVRAQDQAFHELEQRYLSLHHEHEILLADRKSVKELCDKLRGERDALLARSDKDQQAGSHLSLELKQNENKLKDLALENESTRERLSRANLENDRLREDFQSQVQELSALQNRLKDAQVALSEAQSKELPLQFELSKATRERDLLAKKMEHMDEEIQRLSLSERSRLGECNEKIRNFELRVTSLESDLAAKVKEAAALKDQLALQQEKCDGLAQRLQAADSEQILQSAAATKEVDALKRLADLYKNHFEDASAKVGELESKLSSAGEANNQALAEAKRTMQIRLEDYEQSLLKDNEALKNRVVELEAKVQEFQAEFGSQRAPRFMASIEAAAVDPTAPAELNTTAMYDRIVKLEREVIEQQRLRKESEMYLHQIVKDVEAKAPALAKQRRDYQRMVEYYAQLTTSLDQLTKENATLKANMDALEKELDKVSRHRELLEQHNADLSQQIQHLLRSSAAVDPTIHLIEDDRNAEDVDVGQLVTQRLVTFRSIAELQQRNEELLHVLRKLTTEDHDPAKDQEALNPVMEELQQLRDARQRSEEMIAVVIQQRDIYKAMVDGDAAPSGSPRKLLTASDAVSKEANEDLQGKLSQATEANRRLQEQLTRVHEADNLLHETVDKLRSELTSARLEGVQASSEARFHRERVERLEDALKQAQQEASASLIRRMDMDKTLQDAQRDVRLREERINAMQEKVRLSKDASHRLEVELEVTKASEARLALQVAEIREEMKRNVSLAEHLHRIEQGLHNRSEQERQHVLREKETVETAYKSVKKQLDERMMIEHQRVQSAEEEVRSLQVKLERKTAEADQAQESLARQADMMKAFQDRSTLLEKQLALAQDRLANVHGAQFNDEILEKAVAEKEMALEQAHAEIAALKQQLAAAEVHSEQYQKISSANEQALRSLQSRSADSQRELESRLVENQEALERAKADVTAQRDHIAQLVREVEQVREQERTAAATAAESTQSLQAEVNTLKQDNDQLVQQMDLVRADVLKFQHASHTAFEDYERELQQHARAERELREERGQSSTLREEVARLQALLADQSVQFMRADKLLADEKQKNAQELSALKEQLDNLQRTNDAMHNQIQSYSVQMEKLYDQKLTSVSDESTSGAVGASAEDIQELKKASTEMREVLCYMKREKEMLQAKLHVLESENSRYLSQLQSFQKTTDELRSELKKEAGRRVEVRSEEDFNKLLAEVGHVNIVRESNAHLRAENEDLAKKINTLSTELQQERVSRAPFEDSIRKLTAEKEALELVNDQLTNDVSYWKNRLHILVSRYNDVDPEEHRLLKTRLDETLAALESAQSRQAELEEAVAVRAAGVADKEKEIAAIKVAMEGAEKNATTLRDRLRAFKSKIEELEGRNKELTKTQAGKDTQLAALVKEVEEAQAQAASLNAQLAESKRQQTAMVAQAASVSAPTPAVSSSELVKEAVSTPLEQPAVEIAPVVVAPVPAPIRTRVPSTTASAPAPPPAALSAPVVPAVEEPVVKPALSRMKQSLLKRQSTAIKAAPAVEGEATSGAVSTAEEVQEEPAAKKSRVEVPVVAEAPMVLETADAPKPQPAAVEAEMEVEAPPTTSASVPQAVSSATVAEKEEEIKAPEEVPPAAMAPASNNPFASAAKPAASLFGTAGGVPKSIFGSSPFGAAAPPTPSFGTSSFGAAAPATVFGSSAASSSAPATSIWGVPKALPIAPLLGDSTSTTSAVGQGFGFAPAAAGAGFLQKAPFNLSAAPAVAPMGSLFGASGTGTSNPWKTSTVPVTASEHIGGADLEEQEEQQDMTMEGNVEEGSALPQSPFVAPTDDELISAPATVDEAPAQSAAPPAATVTKAVDPAKKMQMRAARFAQQSTAAAGQPAGGAGRGKKRPAKGLKGAAQLQTVAEDEGTASAGEIEEGQAE